MVYLFLAHRKMFPHFGLILDDLKRMQTKS